MGNFSNELKNWQQIPKPLINDNTLSDRARFVYCYMACKPDDWDFYMQPLAKDLGYSVDTLRKYINELIQAGWLSKGEQTRTENNTFGATKYTLHAIKKVQPFSDTEKFRHGKIPTQNNTDINNNKSDIRNKEDTNVSKKDEENEFVERMYKLYPTKCPCRNASLGKCSKDKVRIKRLLKTYTKEQIEAVIKNEVDTKYGKSWMQNFSTFLNNFPDPNCLFNNNQDQGNTESKDDKLIIDGVEYQ